MNYDRELLKIKREDNEINELKYKSEKHNDGSILKSHIIDSE